MLNLMVKNPKITQAQLMEELHLTRKQIQRDINELKQDGVIVREGSNRNGSWIIISSK